MSIPGADFCLACPGSHVRAGVIAVEGVGLCCAPCAKRIEATGIRPEIPEGPGLPVHVDVTTASGRHIVGFGSDIIAKAERLADLAAKGDPEDFRRIYRWRP